MKGCVRHSADVIEYPLLWKFAKENRKLDGGYHSLPQQLISDEQRTADLQEMGYRVIRFTNEEFFQGIDLVLTKIKNALNIKVPF